MIIILRIIRAHNKEIFMGKNFLRKLPVLLTFILVFMLTILLAVSLTSNISYGESSTVTDIRVGHISDIHYFPYEYCYTKTYRTDKAQYESTDFFDCMTGDTKLVLESGITLISTIKAIIEDAKAGKAPDYFVVTGDLCKNGERIALIDVANALRYLQNEVRKESGYENFQIFVITGNHDLYNESAEAYDPANGKGYETDIITLKEYALIFAGLGYPDADIADNSGEINLLDYLPDESYWSSSFTNGYIHSKNASNLKITYYSEELNSVKDENTSEEKLAHYYNLSDANGLLSYYAEITGLDYAFFIADGSDRESVEKGKGGPARISEGEFIQKYESAGKANKEFSNHEFYLGYIDNGIEKINRTPVSYAAVKEAYTNGEKVYISASYKHYTGGRIITKVLDWAEELCDEFNSTGLEKTVFSAFHMNVLPHWEQEDDILKDFTLYNWEYTAKRLLDMGIRYAYTGHQHASDVMFYTDIEGRTLYDMETGSLISYDSPRRYTDIKRVIKDGEFKGESFNSSLNILDSLKEVPDVLVGAEAWDQGAYNIAIAAYKDNMTDENWANVIASNPDYSNYILKYEELSLYSYNEFINSDIYTRLLDRIVGHFLNDNLIATLKGLLTGVFSSNSTVMNLITKIIKAEDLEGLCNYLIDQIAYNLTDTYGDGTTASRDRSVISFVRDFIDQFLSIEFGDADIQSTVNPANKGKMNVPQIAEFIMLAHAGGTEIILCESEEELQAEYLAIDSEFTEIDYSTASSLPVYPETGEKIEEFRFMNPQDATYRKRMTAAVYDLHKCCLSGDFAEFLFYALFAALYDTSKLDENIVNNSIYKSLGDTNYFNSLNQDKSVLKLLLEHKFDLSKAATETNPETGKTYISGDAYTSVEKLCTSIPTLLPSILNAVLGITVKTDIKIDPKNLVLLDVVNTLMPLVQSLLADLIGFNLAGDTLYEAVDNAIGGYITRSFEVGLGGIADKIVVGYATDVYPELADKTDQSAPFTFEPFNFYNNTKHLSVTIDDVTIPMTYMPSELVPSGVNKELNPATQENGRVPSRLTSNFDNADPTGSYTVKFYTEENVYAEFILMDKDGNAIASVSTSKADSDTSLDKKGILNKPYIDSTASVKQNDITISMLTQTKPQYIPLIDLGILCITHGEIADENDVPYTYQNRDDAPKNSVIYWNVTTVTISGLKADTVYTYDVLGRYTSDTNDLTFSLAEFNGTDSFTMKTAKSTKSNDSFEFLAIADIQGMIDTMYQDSYKAVAALMSDDRTKDFDFFINAGDMCDNPKNFNQWAMACDTYIDLFANYSQFFTAGNHENDTSAMSNYFNYSMPLKNSKGATYQTAESIPTGIFYSFDYGTLHVTVLNTNDADDKGLSSAQFAWLKEDLKKSTAKWKIVLMHKSLYSAGSHSYDSEVVAMRKQLVPVFAQYGVSIVFGGHDHTYTTTVLLDKNGNEVTNAEYSDGFSSTEAGTIYITLGSMGTKFYDYSENPVTASMFDSDKTVNHTLTTQTFGKVKIDGDKLTYTSYYYDAVTDTIAEMSKINLKKDDTVIKEAVTAAIKITTVSFKKSASEINDADIIDLSVVPAGYTVSYLFDGQTITTLSSVSFKGKSATADIILTDRLGNNTTIGTVTIENGSYAMTIGLAAGIPAAVVVIIVGIVVGVVVSKKKKKA